MIHAFPKIFSIGQDYIQDLFLDPVEITEKIDGSQFVMGKIDGQLYMRSKGKQIFPEDPEKMFQEAINYCVEWQRIFLDGMTYFCEYLKKPHHNVLNYSRTPLNNLILFGVSNQSGRFTSFYDDLADHAHLIGVDVVPLLFHGRIESAEDLKRFLLVDSVLGNTKIEGVVVKNYLRPFLLGGQPIPVMMGKYVSEAFKEKHQHWGKEHTGRGKFEDFCESFRTEARWQKAVQHLAERGELENAPRDIGKLILEVKNDITEEEKEFIQKFLWKEFGAQILRKSTAGLPEWYKNQLLARSFNG